MSPAYWKARGLWWEGGGVSTNIVEIPRMIRVSTAGKFEPMKKTGESIKKAQ
jgi:hypothetical protein